MNHNKNTSRGTRKARKPRNRNRTNQLGSNNYQISHPFRLSRSVFPRLPQQLQVALFYSDSETAAGVASDQIQYGLWHFSNRLPLYATQLFNLYVQVKVLRVEINWTITNDGATSIQVTTGTGPYTASTLPPLDISETKFGTSGIIATSTGNSSLRMKRTYIPSSVEGSMTTSDDLYWYNQTSSSSVPPKDLNSHMIYLDVRPVNGTVMSYSRHNRITFHCEFFGLAKI